jgi:hypothetical protein
MGPPGTCWDLGWRNRLAWRIFRIVPPHPRSRCLGQLPLGARLTKGNVGIMTLDLDDPLILRMAERNHVPQEEWITHFGGPSGHPCEVITVCEKCGQDWPCETRKRIRAMGSER